MPNKKLYPRPPQPAKAESYTFRPSSPIQTASPSRSRFFRSTTTKPTKPPSEVTRIPWEASPPSEPATSPPSNPVFEFARSSSPPISTCSYESSHSSSRSQGFVRRRGGSAGGSQDLGGLRFAGVRRGPGQDWNDEASLEQATWSEDDEAPLSASPGKKSAGRRREMVKGMLGLQKKHSNFSLKGLVRSVGRDHSHHSTGSVDQSLSPPSSPTTLFPPSMSRQHSSPEFSKTSKRPEIPRSMPSSPILPLPFPIRERDRTMSSPAYANENVDGLKGSVRGKAAKFLGEDIVPHGKAARLLGVESKPTLHTKPSMTSLAESAYSDDTHYRSRSTSRPISPHSSFFDPFHDSPPSIGSPFPARSERSLPDTPPYFPNSPVSRFKKQHNHNDSASDPFWQSVSNSRHTPVSSPPSLSTDLVAEGPPETSPADEARETLSSRPSSPPYGSQISPVQEEPESDPTDSVYMGGGSRNHSSLYSVSLDLQHLSTYSSTTNISPTSSNESPTANFDARVSPESYRFPSIRKSHSSSESFLGQLSPSHSRFSASPSPRASSRLSQLPSPTGHYSTSSSAVSLLTPILPAPTTGLPPLPSPSRRTLSPSSSLASFASRPPSTGPLGPLPPLPLTGRLPSLPRLDPPLALPDFSSSSPTSPIRPQPKRSNTLISVASAGTRRRQHSNALEALEGRRGMTPPVGAEREVDSVQERGSRKRAALARKVNRIQAEEGGVKAKGPMKEVEKAKRTSTPFLDLDASDESDAEEEEGEKGKEEEERGGKDDDDTHEPPPSPTVTIQSPHPRKISLYPSPSDSSFIPDQRPSPLPHISPSHTRNHSISSEASNDSRMSESSILSAFPSSVTASSFPQPPMNLANLPYLSPIPPTPAPAGGN